MRLHPTASALAASVAACLIAAGAAPAAPAVSDFERAVPIAPAGTIAAAASTTRTITLDPGRSFELVGFRWRGLGTPRISLQSEGPRGWSEWVTPQVKGIDGPDPSSRVDRHAVRSSEPVWTGPSRRIRVRIAGSGFSNLRAHYVRVSQSPVASVAGSGGARPQSQSKPLRRSAEAPAIVDRAQWDPNNSCKPRTTPYYSEVQGTVVHHTESTNSYSRAQAKSVILGICRFHRNGRKWNDIGYNLLIDRFGTVYEGRSGGVDRAVVGAHTQGYNGQTSGISLIGSFTGRAPSAAAMSALRKTLKWKLDLAGITRNERVGLISTGGEANRYKNGRLVFVRPVSGHRDLDSTACPGNVLYSRLKGVQSFLSGGSRSATKMSIRLRAVPQGDGTAVEASGRLRSGTRNLAGRSIQLEGFNALGWKQLGSATTDSEGIWRLTLVPDARVFLRGNFTGSGELRPVRSRWYESPKVRVPTGVTPVPTS